MNAIPTIYKGQLFRSRLEAKWACFFDLVGWEWEYEPMDLNGWIPDFLINGHTKLLCDVKPTQVFVPAVAQKMENAVKGSGFECELIIIAMAPFKPTEPNDCLGDWAIGWLQQKGWDEESGACLGWDARGWGEAAISFWSAGNGKLGLCHADCIYRDRISGGYDGGRWGRGHHTFDPLLKWRQACNEAMWNRPAVSNR